MRKKIPSFSNHFVSTCFVETNLQVTEKAYTSVHSYPVSRNDPRNNFTADKNYKSWCSAREEHLEVQPQQHQFVQNQLTPLKWSRIFSKDQTRFSSLTIRKEWTEKEMGQCVMVCKSTARQRSIALDRSFANKALFLALWQNENNFRSSSGQE